MPYTRLALVAEDDAEVRDLIELVLSQSGFTVVLAADGPEAIAAVREHQPLLTTLDVNMPGMDGFAVAKRIREFSHTYLIMITSLTSEIDIIRGFEAGADDYLVKPFRPRELRARADSMLRRASYAPPPVDVAPPAVTSPAPDVGVDQATSWASQAAQELRDASGPPPGRRAPAASEPAEPAPTDIPVPRPAAASATALAADHHAIAHEAATDGDVLRFADLTIATTSGIAALGGRALELSRPEAEILLSLMRTGRRVRSRADLVLALRGQPYVTTYFVNEADKRGVDTHVANLRRKLGDDGPSPRYIETVRGVGFRMAEG